MRILLTGGTGSIGQVLVDKLLRRTNHTIIIYSRDEQKQEKMAAKFSKYADRLRFFLGDVRDKDRLRLAVSDSDQIIHAAALKIVPALEYNPMEAVKTNVIGTQNLIECCLDSWVDKVIALSTDKAVAPVNLYGATKLCLEKLIIAANNIGRPVQFSAVRYGNVAMSRGSVIPKFLEQRNRGEKITITDERMTRFWITLDEASDFILMCLDTMRGGEVFVPKMPSFRIADLATILSPNHVEYVGKRPGEKIHEMIISEDEHGSAFDLDSYYVLTGNPDFGGKRLSGALTSENFKMPIEELNNLLFRSALDEPLSSN